MALTMTSGVMVTPGRHWFKEPCEDANAMAAHGLRSDVNCLRRFPTSLFGRLNADHRSHSIRSDRVAAVPALRYKHSIHGSSQEETPSRDFRMEDKFARNEQCVTWPLKGIPN